VYLLTLLFLVIQVSGVEVAHNPIMAVIAKFEQRIGYPGMVLGKSEQVSYTLKT
jgi:hypothetical protein